MKNLLWLAALVVSTTAFAQKKTTTVEEDLQAMVQAYSESKREMLDEFMQLTGEQADLFWKVYDEYEVERQELAGKKFDLIVDYAANYEALTAEKADELVNATFAANMAYEKMNQKYYNKVKKEIGALQAARFTQFETYLQSVIQGEIQDELPFIGEMDKKKKK